MLLEQLNTKFFKRYENLIKDLNQFVNETPLVEYNSKSGYNIPNISIDGDGSLLVTNEQAAVQLPPHSRVRVNVNFNEAVMPVMRTAINLSEIELAMNNDKYFNYLFDAVIDELMRKYREKFGAYDLLRFGEFYAKFNPMTLVIVDNTDCIEIRVVGKYAARK
jgi:hypothetical protein